MNRKLLFRIGSFLLGLVAYTAQAQFVETFNSTSLPSGWTNTSSTGSTSAYALWRFSGNPGYAMGGTTDHTGNSGSFAWVDGSSPSGLTSQLTSPSVSAPAVPYVDFYLKSDIGTYNTTFNTFSLDFYDGANWNLDVFTFAGNTSNSDWELFSVALDTFNITGNVQLRFNVGQFGSTAFYNDIALDDISFYNNAPCVAPPTAGTVAFSDTGACNSADFVLSLFNATAGSGISYQWQSSSDSLNWSNMAGGTGSTQITNQTSDTYYRCIVTCSGQSDTTAGFLQAMNPFTSCYCIPVHSNGCVTYGRTDNVTIVGSNLNNTTGCGTNSYTQYAPGPGTTAILLQGNTYTLEVTVGGTSTTYGSKVFAWLDLNQNGIFESSEGLALNSGNGIPNGQTGAVTVTIPANAPVGQTGLRIRSEWEIYTWTTAESCSQRYYGEAEDYVVSILPPPANDAGIASVDTPLVSACAVSNSLWVSLNNYGTDTLTSATLNWSVNGNLQTPTSWTGVVDPLATDTVPSFVGNFSFMVGDSIAVWTTSPNGVIDSLTQNDTMIFIVPPLSLNGNYTIDPLGTGTNNYTSFANAIADLNTVGVCGPVVFEVADGTYSGDQLLFGNILGASTTNTITFKSASGDTTACVVEYTSQGTTNLIYDGVVRFEAGASNIHFEDMKFYNPATTANYSTVVSFNGNAENISFTGCRFENDLLTTSTYASLVYHTSSVQTENVTFDGCTFLKGSYAMYWYASSANPDKNTKVLNSEFINQHYRGTYLYYQENPWIVGNTMTSNSTYTSAYGLMMYYFTGNDIKVNNNHIYQQPGTTWPRYGMYIYAFNGDFNKFAEVMGNSISMPNGGTYGVYYYNNLFIDFMNNSIYFADASVNNEGIYVSSGSLNRWKNNAFQSGNQARAAYIGTTTALMESDNNAWSGENNFVYWGGDQADLTSLQNASGKEANSIELSNIFADTMNLLTCNDSLDGTGVSNPYYMMDKQGDPVDASAVDIGSDQFATASSFNLRDTVGLCALGDTTTLEAWYFDSISWNNGMASGNYYDATSQGVVVVEAHGICGVAYDTVTVAIATPVDLPATSIVCTGGTGMIDAGVSNGSYMWSTGETTKTITVSSAGTYEVTVTDIDGCVSDDQTLAELSIPVDLAEQEAMCDGNPVTIDAGIANGTYTWTNGDATQTTTVSMAGMYGVTVTDADGCVSEDMTEVVAESSPVADFNTAITLYYTAQFTNNSANGDSYMWYFGDGDSSDVMNPTHLYDNTNDSAISYTVTLIVSNACGTDTLTSEVTVGESVGLTELANGAGYEVFPNPNAGQFNIVLSNSNNQEVSYTVVDVQGKIVVQQNIGLVNNAHQERVDVSGVAPGIYFLRLNIGGEISTERIAVR